MKRLWLMLSLLLALIVSPGLLERRAVSQVCFNGQCCVGPGICCTLLETCFDKTYSDPVFIRQKDNGKCVYRCDFTQPCTDVFSDGTFRSCITSHSERYRIGPYPAGACPTSPSVCGDSAAEYVPPGEPD